MLRYRLIRAIGEAFPLVVLFGYIAAFVVAMALMFVFPPGTLLLLGLGLASLALVIAAAKVLAALERLVARTLLAGGACPACGARVATRRDETRPWRCEGCGAVFMPSGAQGTGAVDGTE